MAKGFVVWMTGLSGSGKSTAANLLAERLRAAGESAIVIDGDMVRMHLCSDLGYSKHDRDVNVMRVGVLCEYLSRHGVIVIAAIISPYRDARADVRKMIPEFVEVYMQCSVEILTERDVKGLYKRALAGEIENFTGVSDPYEPPDLPEVMIHSGIESAESGVVQILDKLKALRLLPCTQPEDVGTITTERKGETS